MDIAHAHVPPSREYAGVNETIPFDCRPGLDLPVLVPSGHEIADRDRRISEALAPRLLDANIGETRQRLLATVPDNLIAALAGGRIGEPDFPYPAALAPLRPVHAGGCSRDMLAQLGRYGAT